MSLFVRRYGARPLHLLAHLAAFAIAAYALTQIIDGGAAVNHVRAPALISGLLLVVYFPLILGPAGKTYLHATGHHLHGYLRNWLLITAGLFAGSALVYAIRVRARSRRA
jgi:ABC-type transport system involved in cytochrome c biogenesis permease component